MSTVLPPEDVPDEPPGPPPPTGPFRPQDPTVAPMGWAVAPTTGDPSRPTSTRTIVVAWLVAVLVLALVAYIRMRGISDPYTAGRAVGSVLGPLVLAAVIRWIYVRTRGGGPVLRSPWVPLVAIAFAVVNLISVGASTLGTGSATPTDPSVAMRVVPPYSLTALDAATLEQITAALKAEGMVGQVEARDVVGIDGSVSRLFAIDAAMDADVDLREVAAGMTSGSGLPVTIETIEGTEVALAIGPDTFLGTWIEAPLMVTVAAADEVTLRAVLEAVLSAP